MCDQTETSKEMALKAHLSTGMLTVANAFNILGAIRDPDEIYAFILEFPHVLFSCKVSKDSIQQRRTFM